jgi:hypothetical protein
MLRRRGISSILYFGAAPDDQRGLCAHVWVRDGHIDVIGGETASRYAVLVMCPPQEQKLRGTLNRFIPTGRGENAK